jgi:hypothetical protein
MSLSSAAVAQTAPLSSLGLLPPPALAHRSVVIVAAGGRDLVWPQELLVPESRAHLSHKSQAVEIDDEDALDPQWLSFSTTSKPDKAAIKDALKAGQLIPGAQLLSRRSWRIC